MKSYFISTCDMVSFLENSKLKSNNKLLDNLLAIRHDFLNYQS